MLLTPVAIAVLNAINLAIRAPSYYIKIRDTRNCFTPTPADKQQICEHIMYGEMVESVYDTLIFDDNSISNLKCILGKDGIKEFVSATFPGYEVQTLLASCSTTFSGKQDPAAYMGFVALNKAKRDLAVIFRGTKTTKETFEDAKQIGDYWDVPSKPSGNLTDLDFIKGFWLSWFGDSSGKIVLQRGFKQLYTNDDDAASGNPDGQNRSPQQRILDCVNNCLNTNSIDTVTISGHSLGSSLAEIAALDVAQNLEKLGKNGKVETRLVTFACPRTGSAAMGKEFNRLKVNHYHYLNRGDIVPIMSAPAFIHYKDEYYHERRFDPEVFGVVAPQYFKDVSLLIILALLVSSLLTLHPLLVLVKTSSTPECGP